MQVNITDDSNQYAFTLFTSWGMENCNAMICLAPTPDKFYNLLI